MTPIDFLVSAITRISEYPKHYVRVYNVIQQRPVPAEQVFASMERDEFVTGRVNLEE